jgi:hypothetical protein
MSAMDYLAGIIVLLLVAICAMCMIVIFNGFEADTQFNDTLDPTSYQRFDQVRTSLYVWDYAGAFLLFGIIAVSIISAAFINSHPVLFVASLLFMLIVTTISSVFTYIYMTLASDSMLVAVANNFHWTFLVFQYLPIIGLVAMVGIAVATHGKAGG